MLRPRAAQRAVAQHEQHRRRHLAPPAPPAAAAAPAAAPAAVGARRGHLERAREVGRRVVEQ